MLKEEQNRILTQVGSGTPCGDYLRRFWMPVGLSSELTDFPRRVKVMGEEFALFRDKKGRVGLTGLYCPHRLASFEYGFCEEEGLRCRQHGWLFDTNGGCLEQPAEKNSDFKNNIHLRAYPVKELGGLIFGYLGPGEPPVLPKYDVLVKDGQRVAFKRFHPGNYLQIFENSGALDLWHTVYTHQLIPHWYRNKLVTLDFEKVHERYYTGVLSRSSRPDMRPGQMTTFLSTNVLPTVVRIAIRSRTRSEGQRYDVPAREQLNIYVPEDDVSTMMYSVVLVPRGYESFHEDMVRELKELVWPPRRDSHGKPILETVPQEDAAVTLSPGPITQRQYEHLGTSDIGVIMWRRLLMDGIESVQSGEEPLGILKNEDPDVINVPTGEYLEESPLQKEK
jgi:5,5'-dehydrodivanillate O-demethylase oxygenase subunit